MASAYSTVEWSEDAMRGIVFWRQTRRRKACTFSYCNQGFCLDSTFFGWELIGIQSKWFFNVRQISYYLKFLWEYVCLWYSSIFFTTEIQMVNIWIFCWLCYVYQVLGILFTFIVPNNSWMHYLKGLENLDEISVWNYYFSPYFIWISSSWEKFCNYRLLIVT